jgi:hypothetical protein
MRRKRLKWTMYAKAISAAWDCLQLCHNFKLLMDRKMFIIMMNLLFPSVIFTYEKGETPCL